MSRNNQQSTMMRILSEKNSVRGKGSATATKISYFAKVIDNVDPLNLKRIKVRIEGIDDGVVNGDLPWCISMMPNFYFWIPQKDEAVGIILMNPWNNAYARLYFGPIQLGDETEQSYVDAMKKSGMNTTERS